MKQEVKRREAGFYWVKRMRLHGRRQTWEIAQLMDADTDCWRMLGDDDDGRSAYFSKIGPQITKVGFR